MTIELAGAGKRFNREWIFRHINLQFSPGISYAITGPNGSGKSTLLQVLGGMFQLSEGTISFANAGKKKVESPYPFISLAAPYLEVIEEMTLVEFLQFHQLFKKPMPGISVPQIISLMGLEKAAQKQIRYYSSGMKQRVKLAQAILFDTPVLLLDEPCTNLDAAGIALYDALIKNFSENRIIVVCSNDEVEYRFCTEKISILDYKR